MGEKGRERKRKGEKGREREKKGGRIIKYKKQYLHI